jgi:hypothetical protein
MSLCAIIVLFAAALGSADARLGPGFRQRALQGRFPNVPPSVLLQVTTPTESCRRPADRGMPSFDEVCCELSTNKRLPANDPSYKCNSATIKNLFNAIDVIAIEMRTNTLSTIQGMNTNNDGILTRKEFDTGMKHGKNVEEILPPLFDELCEALQKESGCDGLMIANVEKASIDIQKKHVGWIKTAFSRMDKQVKEDSVVTRNEWHSFFQVLRDQHGVVAPQGATGAVESGTGGTGAAGQNTHECNVPDEDGHTSFNLLCCHLAKPNGCGVVELEDAQTVITVHYAVQAGKAARVIDHLAVSGDVSKASFQEFRNANSDMPTWDQICKKAGKSQGCASVRGNDMIIQVDNFFAAKTKEVKKTLSDMDDDANKKLSKREWNLFFSGEATYKNYEAKQRKEKPQSMSPAATATAAELDNWNVSPSASGPTKGDSESETKGSSEKEVEEDGQLDESEGSTGAEDDGNTPADQGSAQGYGAGDDSGSQKEEAEEVGL